mmetsp:Transcript_12364/g.49546  ORF Transcript_12364/g.49546 Transcript_12364/m.49546 type:complete len:195 (+) Transcript_12364:36-620(+)|eukprot:CAMPEP_0114630858 /NCGR_PEP_ID=MMETSP0168-20121206/14108_1 /TAXON_ID=95228 ORGANISM="Vannella sp., Strain DIVA3 517/6/12" /NCGR_SAMPLE_ID=MMETSP0168 /ASSEMBLY_ACC=CAM_ASM_000044 /LENGTH=194 /DNA_ID=CAMNT_0001842395 /DNA_START=32 /DNA_END=616 /DNA_ORIENTATION=+
MASKVSPKLLLLDGNQLSIVITSVFMLFISAISVWSMLYALSNWGSFIFLSLLFGGMALIGFVAAILRNKVFCIVFAVLNGVVMVLFTLAAIATPTLILDFDFMVLVGAIIADIFYIIFFGLGIYASVLVFKDSRSQWKVTAATLQADFSGSGGQGDSPYDGNDFYGNTQQPVGSPQPPAAGQPPVYDGSNAYV